MKIGVSFALLQGLLLAGEIRRSAFLERASPLGTGTSEAAAAGDKVLAIAANHAARQKDLKSSYGHIAVRSGAPGSVVARRLTGPTRSPHRIRHRYVHWDVLQVVGRPNNAVPWFAPNVPAANINGMF